jgi:hypothetical protein
MGSDAEQKIRQLGIPVGSVRSPWLVVSVFRHGFLSNSLPLSFGDSNTHSKRSAAQTIAMLIHMASLPLQ